MGARVWGWERAVGVLWAATVAAIYLLGGFERLELITYDWRMRWFATPPRDAIVIVAIDNPSVKALTAWPWPRAVHAQTVEILTRAGARVIAFDVDFSTARRDADDARFARAVARSDRVVIAAFHERRTLESGAVLEYANLPYPALRSAAHAIGSINLPVDPDGILRRSPVTAEILGDYGWSFATEIARTFWGAEPRHVRHEPDGTLWIDTHRARIGDGWDAYVRFFGGPTSFPSVSYADVLEGRIDPRFFADKIVLIGATSLELQDLRPTPFPGLMPGVEIQANAIETILSGAGYRRIPSQQILAAIGALMGLWTVILASCNVWRQRDTARRSRTIALMGVAVLAGIGVAAFVGFDRLIFLDVVPLLATAAGQVATSLVAGYISAERRVEFQSENLHALYRMGEETRGRTTLDRMTDLLFAQTRQLLAVDRLGIDLWDDALQQPAHRLWRDALGTQPPLPLEAYRDVLDRVRTAPVPTVVPNLTRRQGPGLRNHPIRSSLFVPMIAQNQMMGVLHVHRLRPMPFGEDEAKTLLTLATQAALNLENAHLLDEVRTLFQRSLEAFSTALDFKDNDTGGHSQRVSMYAIEVARRMGISHDQLDVIGQGALLHDIGKIAVPDRILLKAGSLSEEEWVIMRKHPETGYHMLKTIQIPEPIAAIVRHHHERFGGGGYPAGLRGDQIVLGARIFSVADLYDAMTSDRPYRKALSMDHVVAELKRISGTQLDPEVVEAFLGIPETVFTQLRATMQGGLAERRIA